MAHEICAFNENHIRQKNTKISEFMISIGYFVFPNTFINDMFESQD